jgi:putative redox protein
MIRATSLPTVYQTAFTNGRHESVADVPVEKGDSGQGLGPHELLEAALATCLTMTAGMYAAKHGLALDEVRCEVRIDRADPDAARLCYSLAFDGSLTDEQGAGLRAAVGHCPVVRTLTGNLTVATATFFNGEGSR